MGPPWAFLGLPPPGSSPVELCDDYLEAVGDPSSGIRCLAALLFVVSLGCLSRLFCFSISWFVILVGVRQTFNFSFFVKSLWNSIVKSFIIL